MKNTQKRFCVFFYFLKPFLYSFLASTYPIDYQLLTKVLYKYYGVIIQAYWGDYTSVLGYYTSVLG